MVNWFRDLGDRFGVWAILLIAALTRLWNLQYPNKLVFDETYYVKDAYSLWKFGHEVSWSSSEVKTFDPNQLLNSPEFVVHAPLGKWLIGLGMQVFGPSNPIGWRIVPALVGIASVWLVYKIALEIFGSKRWALLPAFLLAIDGQAIVISRTAILDGLVMFFVVLGFYFLVRAINSEQPSMLLIVMVLVLGAGAGVKWSSALFLAVFMLYYAWTKKRWTSLLYLPLAAVPYLLSWIGWFVTQGWGYQVGNPVGSFISYHLQMYHFHSTLYSYHPYQSSASTWLAMLRPTSFFFENNQGTVSAINPIGNPVIWLAGIAALGMLFAWFAQNRDKLGLLVFTGYVAGYLPWLVFSGRTSFQFYSVVFEPWILLAITLMAYRYRSLKLVVWASLATFAIFLFFLPIYLGFQIPLWFWQLHMWLPTWI
jgi:dolichyl-phosphate-mannose--protein O-mannosyl transferase